MQSKCTNDCKKPTPAQAHCGSVGCHRTFGGVTGFDDHRTGELDRRICLDPTTFGFVLKDGVWRDQSKHDEVDLFTARVRGTRGKGKK